MNIDSLLAQNPQLTKAVVAYLIQEDSIILGLRKKVSNNLGQSLLSGIGGKLEEGESNEDALLREIDEEIGVKVKSFRDMGRVRFLFPHKPKWHQDVRIYLVDDWVGEPIETEPIKPEKFNINEIPFERMWHDNSFWLPRILKGEVIDAVYLCDENAKVIEEQIQIINK